MNPYVIFKGISSLDFAPDGLIIEQLPDEHKPAHRFEETPVPGRDGRLTSDLGGLDIYQTSMKINCNGAQISDVYAWLDGEGWITTSDDPEFMRYVGFYETAKDQRFRAGACFDTITFPMRVQPYKYKAVQDEITIISPTVFYGQGNADAKPMLEISGSGDITLMINGQTVLIKGMTETIILDCDVETAYTEMDGVKYFAGRKITVVNDDWPRMNPGENSVSWSGTISQIIIHPWWRWY